MKTNKLMIVSLFILIAVFLSACGPAALPTSSAAQRSLTVSGSGQVSLKPDIATIYIGVHTELPSAAESVAENNSRTQKLIEALKAAGVDANDIQTMNFSIWQSQQYGPDGQVSGTVYAVDNTVYLTIRNLDKLGDLLDAAVRAGANNINSIQFDVADKSKALSDARAEAVKAAQAQAGELAAAAGVSLGEIQSIQYYDASPAPIYQGKGMGGGGSADASLAVPITPGQLQISATVTIAYGIK